MKTTRRLVVRLLAACVVWGGSAWAARQVPDQAGTVIDHRTRHPSTSGGTYPDDLVLVRPGGLERVKQCLVRIVGAPTLETRSEWEFDATSPGDGLQNVAVYSAQIVDAVGFKPGTMVRLVSNAPGESPDLLAPNQTYFVLLLPPIGAKLPCSVILSLTAKFHPEISDGVDRKADDEYALVDDFPTQAQRLVPGENADDVFVANLLEVAKSAHGAYWTHALDRLAMFGAPGDASGVTSAAQNSNRWSESVATMIANELQQELRIRFGEVLCAWNILGAKYLYGDALMDVADDPEFVIDPADLYERFSWEDTVYDYDNYPDFTPPEFDFARAQRLALHASNESVRGFLMRHYLERIKDEDMPTLLADLRKETIDVKIAMLNQFKVSYYLKNPQIEWKLNKDSGLKEPSNLDEVIAYWEKRFPLK